MFFLNVFNVSGIVYWGDYFIKFVNLWSNKEMSFVILFGEIRNLLLFVIFLEK